MTFSTRPSDNPHGITRINDRMRCVTRDLYGIVKIAYQNAYLWPNAGVWRPFPANVAIRQVHRQVQHAD